MEPFIKKFLYYQGVFISLLFFFIVFFQKKLYETISGQLNILSKSQFFLVLIGIWIYISFRLVQDQHYKRLTGRSYGKDHAQFKKSYGELVSFFKNNDPYKIDVEALPIEDWHDADGVILGKTRDCFGNERLIKKNSDAPGNLICFGLPGSGKTTAQAATTCIRFNSNRGGGGIFAISIKGDLLNFIRSNSSRNVKVFTPARAEGSCHYDPLQGVADMDWTGRKLYAENLARIICPDEAGENTAFFVEGARNYFAGVFLYHLYLFDLKKKKKLHLFDMIDYILANNVFDVTKEIHDCGNSIPGTYTNGYIGSSEKNVSGIYSQLCSAIRKFDCGSVRQLFDGEGDCIRPEDLNSCDIIIDVPQESYELYATCMRVIITNFLQSFMQRADVSSQGEISPILFLLDEAAKLQIDFSILAEAMATLRSKKVSIFLLLQSVAQLQRVYGNAQAKEIMDLCAYISLFNAQDPHSRSYFQELVGKRKMLKRTSSLSHNSHNHTSGKSVAEYEEYIFQAADFGDLSIHKGDKKLNRVLIYANGKYCLAETTPCYEKKLK